MANLNNEHSQAIHDQTRLAGPTDDQPRRLHANPNRGADKPCMPCGCKTRGRNLIVCIDGTSNQFGKKNTNVIELYNLILKKVSDDQRTWYNSGIGTYARPSWKSLSFYKKVLYHKIDLAIAWDFERTVLGAYRWLSDNYEEDDRIFLFGFSRGAFQVRVLSAMIDKVGLVYKGNEMQIPFAYELYADHQSGGDKMLNARSQVSDSRAESPTLADRFKKFLKEKFGSQVPDSEVNMADHFKRTFSNENVKVHFVGAWDTVSSIGVARGQTMLPGTIDGMTHVCYFRHALALDERRVKFLPEYAYGGSAKPAESEGGPEEKAEKDVVPHTKEVWFAGTHSDIGGGNVDNAAMDGRRPPLRWMVFEAAAAGLRTARFDREPLNYEQINIIESLTWPWLLFEILPFKRLTFTRNVNFGPLKMTRKPHLGSSRKIHKGQKIHSSLVRASGSTAEGYTPKARPLDDNSTFWETLRKTGISEENAKWLELDLYEDTANAVEQLIAGNDYTALESLHHIAISGDGHQAVYSKVIEALNKKKLTPEDKDRLLHASMEVLRKRSLDGAGLRLTPFTEIRPALLDLLNCDNGGYQKTAAAFMALFTDPSQIFHLDENLFPVALSLDGTGRVIGRPRSKLALPCRIWDVATGKPVGEPLRGHSHWVHTVAFSPGSKRIVSGSADTTIRIWDAETGNPVGEPLQGSGGLMSVAFSPDGTRVVSGSFDGTGRIWDAETGLPVGQPLRGHSDHVSCVAFSPDGTRVVSASSDQTVRIWNAEMGTPVGEPLEGHSDEVNSVAFSPDGTRIVSGSDDQTVRIWDAETGKPIGEPLRGHSEDVKSVVFSPDGTRIVSGSQDGTVRIWDTKTGKAVGKPLRGHARLGGVRCVAFNPDGTRIGSCSIGTLRIWDLEALGLVDTPGARQTAS